MTVRLSIRYHCDFGDGIAVEADGKIHPMVWTEGDVWRCDMTPCPALYRYCVCSGNTVKQREKLPHTFPRILAGSAEVTLRDVWHQSPSVSPFLSSFFTEAVCGLKRNGTGKANPGHVLILASSGYIEKGRTLAVTGSSPEMGEWSRPRRMQYLGDSLWGICLPMPKSAEFKFVKADSRSRITEWEEGGNRTVSEVGRDEAACMTGLEPRFVCGWKGAGVAVPVFSLRGRSDLGCGEFRDLEELGKWCARCGMSMIQILPVNDTLKGRGDADSYPYSAVSAFALNPIYMDIRDVCTPADGEMKSIAAELGKADRNGHVLFGRVAELKTRYLRLAFRRVGKSEVGGEEYGRFVERNGYWIYGYEAYRTLASRFGTFDTAEWKGFESCSQDTIDILRKTSGDEMDFHGWVQFRLFAQMRRTRDALHSMGIGLKGDLPIGVDPKSCDVWMWPGYFRMDGSAGAPPDAFSRNGQNWGFPIYDWEAMKRDGYRWWRERLRVMEDFFDAFRIDHILGFFRIWEVPRRSGDALLGEFYRSLPYTEKEIEERGCSFALPGKNHKGENLLLPSSHSENAFFPAVASLSCERFLELDDERRERFRSLYEDFYYRRNESLWRNDAEERLEAVCTATRMLVCGEDLGMIPECVPETMGQRKILSLEVERMPKQMGLRFGKPETYPRLSVCTTGTHDTPTLRQWLCADKEATKEYLLQAFATDVSGDFDSPEICRRVVERNLGSPSLLSVLPLQDCLSVDEGTRARKRDSERINDPSDPHQIWNYRMHCRCSDLYGNERLVRILSGMILRSGRKN